MKVALCALLFYASIQTNECVNFNPIVVLAQSADEENTTLAEYITFQNEQVKVLLPTCSNHDKYLFGELLGDIFYGRDVQECYNPQQKRFVSRYSLHRKKIAQLISMLTEHQAVMTSLNREQIKMHTAQAIDSDKVILLAYFGTDSEPVLISPSDTKYVTSIQIGYRMNSDQFNNFCKALDKFYNDGAHGVAMPIDIKNLKTIHELLEHDDE